ncbi:heavy-metal-associated domain-containing protein [Paraburkholderia kirstenboschensis]|uniref:Heavy-metal-associated domain-containing protein n=1 Tax=Paraburkholderia kirstenboschensis TaxID=1245436 RepID=A0ABZ0EKY4_9BURK|nr:heavy-metal-associated domain-containing protein [Paraburkholderia kirstenboschensis]WOD17279.1 heavy-metal-associated domain-containing protein [Paraburkholderia kirstenboschensis]
MELTVQDKSCGGCANAIARAIAGLDPAAAVDIGVSTKIVKIAWPLAPTQFIETIAAAGFPPSVRD